jgi:hypothetical protein
MNGDYKIFPFRIDVITLQKGGYRFGLRFAGFFFIRSLKGRVTMQTELAQFCEEFSAFAEDPSEKLTNMFPHCRVCGRAIDWTRGICECAERRLNGPKERPEDRRKRPRVIAIIEY